MKATDKVRQPAHRIAEWSLLRIHLIWAYRGPPPYAHFDLPEQSPIIVWRIEKGTVRVGFEHAPAIEAGAGTWVMPARDKIRHDFSPDAIITSVRFKAHWPGNVPLFDNTASVTFARGRFPKLESATRQLLHVAQPINSKKLESSNKLELVSMFQRSVAFTPYLRMHQETLRWIHTYSQVMARLAVPFTPIGIYDARVVQVRQMIDDMDISSRQRAGELALARSVGLSVSQLNRLFVAAVGMTPRAYIEKRRIDFAKESLLGSGMSVKEIAYLLGFAHSSHFSAWFRKKLWVYPTEFRAMTKNTDVTRLMD